MRRWFCKFRGDDFFSPRHYNKCNLTLFRLWVSRGPTEMNSYQISTAVVLLLSTAASAQRTPTISYITPDITSKIGGTIEMDCSVLYAAEYPVLWVKLPPQVQHLLWYLTTPILNFLYHVRRYDVSIQLNILLTDVVTKFCDFESSFFFLPVLWQPRARRRSHWQLPESHLPQVHTNPTQLKQRPNPQRQQIQVRNLQITLLFTKIRNNFVVSRCSVI